MIARPSPAEIEALVRMALAEDMPWGDITSETLVPAGTQATAQLVAREPGILCGEDIFANAMRLCGDVTVTFSVHDGGSFPADLTLATMSGPARAILAAERVALNFTQRLSGISTMTREYVDAVAGTGARIIDTRKTTPGLRRVERYAVRCGGGTNHRTTLSDALLAKDNHLAALCGADLTTALRQAFAVLPHTVHREVEVDRLDQIAPVLAAGVDTVLLDNFSLADLETGVAFIRERGNGHVRIEASGGVTLETVRDIAGTGVDLISVGALTHSVRALDLGLDFS